MRKISKLLLSISLVISLLVACGGVVLADSTTPTETSYVSQSTAMGADWEKYYGKTGYVILAGSGGTFYSNMYSDYSGTEVIKGKCVNYGTVYKEDSTTETGIKSDAIISRWGYNGGTWSSANNYTTLYIPGTTTNTNARIHNSGADKWYIGMLATTTASTYLTVYIPKAYGGTISETDPVEVYLYNCYVTGQKTSLDPYTNLLATARVTANTGTYVTFYVKDAGDYTIVVGGDSVENSIIKPMMGGLFFDDVDPNSKIRDKASYVLNDITTDSDWEGTFGNDGYIILNADYSNKDSAGNSIDTMPNAYTKGIYLDENGDDYTGQVYFTETNYKNTAFELTTKEGYEHSGKIISRYGTATSTWRKQSIPHSLYKPGTQELTNTQVGGSAVAHYGQIAFTLTEEAFATHDTIYVSVYNNMCNGYSEDAYNYTSYVYSDYYLKIDNTPNVLLAKHTIEVKSPRGFYFTYAITAPGDYSIYVINDNKLSLANVQGLFFDYEVPNAIRGTDVEPATQVVPSIGNAYAEVVAVDRYTRQNWEGTYGATAYVMPYSTGNYWPSETHLGTMITKGIYSEGTEYTSGYCLGSQSTSGTFVRGDLGKAIAGSPLTKFALTGSTWRLSSVSTSHMNNGLYLPGTTEPNCTQMAPAANSLAHGFSFCVSEDYDDVTLYVTVYVYADFAYEQNPDFRVAIFNRYSSNTDTAIAFFDTSKTTYKDPIASTMVKGASEGAYVTFAIKGAGTYTILSLGGETPATSISRATTAGLFVDTEIPKFNQPVLDMQNTNLADLDTYYGKDGMMNKDVVKCDLFDDVTNSAKLYAVSTTSTNYYYLSVVTSEKTDIVAYAKYYGLDDTLSDVYKIARFDASGAGIYTIRARGDITIKTDKEVTIYVDSNKPILYSPETVVIDDWTGANWISTYGTNGYYIPYALNSSGVVAHKSGDIAVSMDTTWLKSFSGSYINSPTSTPINSLLNAQRGSVKMAIAGIESGTTSYLTIALVHHYPYGDIDSAYVVNVYANADLNVKGAPIYTNTIYSLDQVKYLTINVESEVCVEVKLLTDEGGATYGYMPSILGVYLDKQLPDREMSEIEVDSDANVNVTLPQYVRVGYSASISIVSKPGYRISSLVIDGQSIDTLGKANIVVDHVFAENTTIEVRSEAIVTGVDIVDYDLDTHSIVAVVSLGNVREVVSYGIEVNGVRYNASDLDDCEYSLVLNVDNLTFVRAYMIYDTGRQDVVVYSSYYVVYPNGNIK